MSIEEMARELVSHREKSTRLLESGDLDGWSDSFLAQLRVAERLRKLLLNCSHVVSDDPAVKKVLRDIDPNEISDFSEAVPDLLYSWLSPEEYCARLIEVRALVAPLKIPPDLVHFLDEARQCYALCQFAAVYSLARTILEVAVNDIGVGIRLLPPEVLKQNLSRKYPISKRFEGITGDHHKQIYKDHYSDLCTVVHGRPTSASFGPLQSLVKTIGFVEYLYDKHKGKIESHKTIPFQKTVPSRKRRR